MEPTDYEYDEYEYDEGRRSGSRILWGRVAVLAVALGLMFFLGRCTAGSGDDAEEVAQLEDRIDTLLEENMDLEAQLDAVAAGGVGAETDDESDVAAEEETSDEGASDEDTGEDEGNGEGEDGDDSGGEPRTHEVQEGESLYRIAQQYYGDGQEFMLIVEANNLDPDDPNIHPGQTLEIPES